MDKLLIEGGLPLHGSIRISGAKNSVLLIMAASLLSDKPISLTNIPRLKDVTTMMELLGDLGVKFTVDEYLNMKIDASAVHHTRAPYQLVKTMRASILVLGPLLARFGKAEVSMPGGCAIGSRPVDVHIEGMCALGAQIDIEDGFIKAHVNGRLKANVIDLGKITVTGTANIIMAATLAQGQTVIRHAAQEPELIDLADFLNKLGAKISGAGSDTITIDGVEQLGGGCHRIIPDRIETGTYLTAAAMTRGSIMLEDTQPEYLATVISKLREAGADITVEQNTIALNMHGRRPQAVDISTAPYPGFPTDMQAQILAMNTIAEGKSTVIENVFENRFMHVDELKRLGADIKVTGNKAHCQGVEFLKGAPVMATDLRASACLVLAGLVATGTTTVDRIYHIDRGYESIECRMSKLGARIRRVLSQKAKVPP